MKHILHLLNALCKCVFYETSVYNKNGKPLRDIPGHAPILNAHSLAKGGSDSSGKFVCILLHT